MMKYCSALKEQGNPTTCNNMDEHGGYYSKRNKPDKDGQTAWCHLYVELKKKKLNS